MDILQTILHRRSIRRFDTRQIEEETLQKILQAGLYAPSAGGRQGVIFAVSQNREVNERLGKIKRANSYFRMSTATRYVSREQPSIVDDAKLTNAFYDAPTVITLFAPKDFLFAAEDCAVAAENMMLAAASLGLGSCWVNQLHWLDDNPRIRAMLRPLGLADAETICGSLALFGIQRGLKLILALIPFVQRILFYPFLTQFNFIEVAVKYALGRFASEHR